MRASIKQLSGPQARTRAAILAATAWVIARDQSATLSDVAAAAGVGRTTVHRYFPDRETLIREAKLDAICVVNEVVREAATDQGPAFEAVGRLVTGLVSIGDRLRFLFPDGVSRRDGMSRPNNQPIVALIERGQREGALEPQLSVTWIEHALYALVQQACEDAISGDLSRHTVVATVMRTLESGIRTGA